MSTLVTSGGASAAGRIAEPASAPRLVGRRVLDIAFALLVHGLLAVSPVGAASVLEDWREEVTRIRTLAEKDVPRAYEAARRLRENLPAEATPADHARALNLLARAGVYQALTDDAAAHAEEALELALQEGDRVGQAEALLNLGLISVHRGDIPQLVEVTVRSLEVLEGVDRPELLGEALVRAASMYRRIGQVDDSVTMAMQAWEIGRRSEHPLALAYAHQGLGITFEQADHIAEAQEHFLAMREQARRAGSRLLDAYAVIGIAGTSTRLGAPQRAEELLNEAIELFRLTGSPAGVAHGLHALAYFLRGEGRHAEAQPLIEEEVEIFERYPSKAGRWFAWNLRSANLESLGRHEAAMADAEAAYRLAEEMGVGTYIAESARHVASLSAARGDYTRAYELAARAAQLAVSTSRERTSTRVLELARRYESESKRREIDELTRRNVEQTSELHQQELQQRWLRTVLLISILALLGASFLLYRLRESYRLLRTVVVQLQDSRTELQRQTAILRSVLDSMADGVTVANERGEWLLVNPAAERIIRSPRMPGDPAQWPDRSGVYLPDQATPYPPAELPLARSIRGESCDNVEMFMRPDPDGEGWWLSVTTRPLIDPDGIVRGGIAVFSDITERKRAEEEIRSLNASLEQRVQRRTAQLRQQTRYLRVLFDTIPLWVWLKDTHSRYLAVNEACAASCGLEVAAMIGKTDFELWTREQAESYRTHDLEVMATHQRQTVEAPIEGKNGTEWIETYTAAVLDEDGTVLGTVGVARNISERKAAEVARERALAEAEHLARMRSEFLAQMSHELRTPLNGILGYAQVLRRDMSLSERQRAGLNVIQQSGEHLLMLIDDILDLSKIEAGKLELCPVDFALDEFLDVISGVIRVKAEQKLLAFQCDKGTDLPTWIRADERRLRQVLLNLLANAVKFTDQGRVTLRVRRLSPQRLRFQVADTGVGVGTDQQEIIFQPFEQAGDIRRRQGGAGLGLSISRQLVRLMGADIHVESRLGQGSTFWFDLEVPVPASGSLPGLGDGMVVGYTGPARKILLVDDVKENRRMLADFLEPLGFRVLEAESAHAGLEKAAEHLPDLVLMDIVMPGMDGLEATRRLRALPALGEVPVIAISAGASSDDEQKSLAAGVNAFVPKPIDLDFLLERITLLLGLELIYERGSAALVHDSQPAEQFALPEGELEVLHGLVLRGDMREITSYANRLEQLDRRYRPFAERLRGLAEHYQSKALRRLVEQCMDERTAP